MVTKPIRLSRCLKSARPKFDERQIIGIGFHGAIVVTKQVPNCTSPRGCHRGETENLQRAPVLQHKFDAVFPRVFGTVVQPMRPLRLIGVAKR